MILNYAIMGSTNDPNYLDFWPVVSKVWKKKFNIIPVLGLICDEESDFYESEYGLIKKIKAVNTHSLSTQSQIVRLYLPKFLDGNSIISDIDMIPLSKKYFVDSINEYSDNELLIMSSHHEQTINNAQYPMCYVAGNNKSFIKIFDLHLDWQQFMNGISNYSWYADQMYLYKKINENLDDTIKFPYREFGINIKRIDRSTWGYNPSLVEDDYYIDSHLLKPYTQYKFQIDALVDLVLKNCDL